MESLYRALVEGLRYCSLADVQDGDFFGEASPPARPCLHRPGSDGKIREMQRRYLRGESLFHERDGLEAERLPVTFTLPLRRAA